jgi:iron complex outermembrane receptor protein
MALAFRPGYRALLQAFGSTVALGLLIQPVLAQEAETPAKAEKIQVTGSAIKRIQTESALPVQTISSAEIAKTGATSVAELMQKLPSMQGFTNDAVSVGGGGAGYSSASVHNLGDTRTLVLLDGRRVATFAGQTLTGATSGVDLNVLPLAAVERVEILTDGASSIYGTDAIGGVVNFILKSDYRGFDVQATYFMPEAGGAHETKFGLTAGWGDLDTNRFNIMASYAHDERSPLMASDRPSFAYPAKGYYDVNGAQLLTTSLRGVPANAAWDKGNNSGIVNPYLAANGACPAYHVQQGPECRYIYPSALEIFPQSKIDSGVLNFNFKINENNTLFATGLVSRHSLTSRIAPPPVELPIDPNGSLYQTYLAPYGVPANADDITAFWRAFDAGKRTTDDVDRAQHFVIGSKGTLFNWDYNAAITHSVNKWNEYYSDGWLTNDGLSAALAANVINPFVTPGNQTPEGMAALDAAKFQGLFKSGTSQIDMVELKASHDVYQLPAGMMSLGLGADFRREKNAYDPSPMAMGTDRGGIAGDFSADVPFDLSRDVWGVFGEVLVPVLKNLETSGSVRYDHYSDFGSTTNFKLSGRWTPVKSLLIRGSVNSGFHAPQPAQLASVTQLYGVTGGQYDCPFPKTDPRSAYCYPAAIQYQEYVSGNPNLKPEKSAQFTFGFRYEPAGWVSTGADYWHVHIRDQFGTVTEQQVANDPEAAWNNGWLKPIYTDPLSGKTYLAFVLPQDNFGDRIAEGLDIDTKFYFRTSIGRVTSQVAATWIFSDKQQLVKGGQFYQIAGRWDDTLGTVAARWKGIWATTLTTGDWDNTLTLNYTSGYDEDRDGNVTGDLVDANGNPVYVQRRVDQWFTADWQTSYRTPVKGLKLTAGIFNIGNVTPPFTMNAGGAGYGQAVGYNTQIADPRGRTYYMTAGYTY